METQLKQRLVGIAVIFSLAVIFLPMLLDGSGRSPQDVVVTIPPEPEINSDVRVEERIIELRRKADQLPTLKPLVIDEISAPPEKEQAAASKETTAITAKPLEQELVIKEPVSKETPATVEKQENKNDVAKPIEKTPPKPQIGGDSWVIQVGSFKDKSKAYKERDRLRKSKLAAVFIERIEINAVPSYRVRMGPFITRQKAKVVGNKILAKYNIKGLIMKYEK